MDTTLGSGLIQHHPLSLAAIATAEAKLRVSLSCGCRYAASFRAVRPFARSGCAACTPPALPYPASEGIEDVRAESEFKPARLKGRGPGSAIDGEAK